MKCPSLLVLPPGLGLAMSRSILMVSALPIGMLTSLSSYIKSNWLEFAGVFPCLGMGKTGRYEEYMRVTLSWSSVSSWERKYF